MGAQSTAGDVARAADVLRHGGLVAFPTETVYGLGADATNPDALRRLYAVKGRPAAHPVIVHVADRAQLRDWAARVPPVAARLAEACWPGPLTIVVERAARVPDEVTGGASTVGVRVPDQPLARALLRTFGDGIAAPSANRFGRVSPTTAAAVRGDLGGEVDLVLDGGPCRVGVESTIVDCSRDDPVVLRPGGVTAERLREILGADVAVARAGERATPAPGTLPSHYAPRATVELAAREDVATRAAEHLVVGRSVGVLCLAPAPRVDGRVAVLDPPHDVDEYAHVLYQRLRDADAYALDVLLAVPPADEGVGAAVADRLRRAAGAGDAVAEARA